MNPCFDFAQFLVKEFTTCEAIMVQIPEILRYFMTIPAPDSFKFA